MTLTDGSLSEVSEKTMKQKKYEQEQIILLPDF